MRSFREDPLTASAVALPVRPQPPGWAMDLFGDTPPLPVEVGRPGPHDLIALRTSQFTLVSAALGVAPKDSAAQFADAVAALYRSVAAELAREERHAVRIWNFVPDIQGAIDGAGDRYMAFNMGRFAAYCDWFGGPDAFRRRVPTSSAVGIAGGTLWVHTLACETPGEPVENPRQIPSYRYSNRYGIRPPCFARATRVRSRVLIGGTASILGERSHHAGDVELQTRETFHNLAALLTAASPVAVRRPLELFRSLRVHVRDGRDAAAVRNLVDQVAPTIPDVELVQASLCRKELLVEIEGVAECLESRF